MKLMDKWSGALAATGKVSLVHASREGGSCSVALSASEVEALKLKIAEERASGVVMTDFEHAGWRMMHWRVWVQVQAESGGAERLVLPEIMEAIPEVARAFVSTCLAQGLRATGVESLSPEEAGVAIAEFEGVLGEAVVRSVREQTEGGQPKAVLKALVQAVQEGDREMKWNAIAKVFERGASNVAVFGRITVRR